MPSEKFPHKEGMIWAATQGGASRFDGKNWKIYTRKDGLADNLIRAIMQDREGAMWFGTRGGGVSRFDGKSWKTYAQKDGLADNWVLDIRQDKEGKIWFGTWGGGVNLYDGRCFQTIDSRDGLVNDFVDSIYLDRSGKVWLGTKGGAVQFTPNKISPPVYITQILADEKIYSQLTGSFNLSPGVRRVAISFHAISFKTRPGGMKYFYQFIGPVEMTRRVAPTFINANWQGPVNQETVEYFNLKPGRYNFRVQAVDRDLNYSETASLELVLPPLWHQIGWIRAMLVGGGLTFFCTFGFVTWRWSANRINTRRLEQRLREQEVKEAQLQMLRYQLNPHFLFNALNSIYRK